jgi:hypothetical protein
MEPIRIISNVNDERKLHIPEGLSLKKGKVELTIEPHDDAKRMMKEFILLFDNRNSLDNLIELGDLSAVMGVRRKIGSRKREQGSGARYIGGL